MKRAIPAVILALLATLGLASPAASETGPKQSVQASPRNGGVGLYVNGTSGNDTWSCSAEFPTPEGAPTNGPCKTISAALQRPGRDDTIYVASGVYDDTITGAGRVRLIGTNATLVGSIAFASNLNGTSRVEGFTFKRPSSVSATTSTYKMVASNGASHVVEIANNTFDLQFGASAIPNKGRGAALSGTSTWRVSGNVFLNQEYSNAYVSRVLFFENAAQSVIEDNEFRNIGHGVFLTGAQPSGSVISANVFDDSIGQAVAVGVPSNVTIRGNTFKSGNSVYLDGSQSVTIENNLFCGGPNGGKEAPGVFPQCTGRTGSIVWSTGSQSGSVVRSNAILGGYSTAFSAPFGGRAIFNYGSQLLDIRNNWWGTGFADDSILAKLYANPGSLPTSPWVETYIEDAAKAGQPGFWPIIPALDVVTPTPDNPDDSVVVAVSGFFTGNSVEITFPTVASAGVTTVTAFDPNGDDTTPFPQAPSGFSLGDSPVYYTITTTATVTFPVTLCFSYAPGSFTSPPKLYHFTGSPGAWVERVTSYQDNPTRACAQVPSFSPFALGVPTPSPGPGPGPVVQPPSQPRNVVGVPGDTVAQVSWAEPVSSGSSAIVGYRVERSDAEGVWSVAIANTGSAGRTVQVSGLVNGTAYRFRVTAINAVGPGPASDPSNAVTPFAPESVSILITGQRTTIKGKPGVRVLGETTGLGEGAVLRPWFRYPGHKGFTRGTARILVDTDGAFTWQRKTGKKITVYIQAGDGTRSNRVVIPAR